MTWLYQTPTLLFDTNFESANLASSERINEFEYDLFIQPDSQTSTRLWFYFRVSQVPLNLPVLFNIIGISKSKTTFATYQRVLVRSTSRPKWQHIPGSLQYYTNSSKHKCYTSNPVLSFLFQFDRPEEYFFAFGYPYTYTMLQKFVTRIMDHNLPHVKVETVGQSSQQRQVQLITIGKPVSPRYKNNIRPPRQHCVFITARCHSGEFPGSYVCHGILEYLMSNNPRARFLRQNVIFKIIPMLNVDGVVNGYYRTNANGADLNRCFDSPSDQSPEAMLAKRIFQQLLGTKPQNDNTEFESTFFNAQLLLLAKDLNLYTAIAEKSDTPASNRSNISEREEGVNLPQKGQSSAKSRSVKPTIVGQQLPLVPSNFLSAINMTDQTDMQTTQQGGQYRLDFVIDLHSHSNIAGGFLFLNPDSAVYARAKRFACEQTFPNILLRNCATFNSMNSSFKESKNTREGSLRRAFCNVGKEILADDSPYVYCLEVSNSHGLDPRDHGKGFLRQIIDNSDDDNDGLASNAEDAGNYIIYTPDKYMTIGERICDSLYDIYINIFKE